MIQYDGSSKILRRICQILNTKSATVTLPADAWAQSNDYGTWAQTVSLSWVSADLYLDVQPVLPAVKAERDAVHEARISCIAVGDGILTFISDAESAPAADIDMTIKQLL